MLTLKPTGWWKWGQAGPGSQQFWGLEPEDSSRRPNTLQSKCGSLQLQAPTPPFHYLGAPTLAAHTPPTPRAEEGCQGLDLLMVPDPGERIKKSSGQTHMDPELASDWDKVH